MLYHIKRNNYEYPKNEKGETSISRRILTGVEDYYFGFTEDSIVVQQNKPGSEIKKIKVESCHDFVFQCLKTKIKAIDGVEGLKQFMSENLNIEDTFGCMVFHIVEHINTYGKITPANLNSIHDSIT